MSQITIQKFKAEENVTKYQIQEKTTMYNPFKCHQTLKQVH